MIGNPVVTLVARAVDIPELRFTPSGKAVTNLTVVTSDRKQENGSWVDSNTTFYRIAAWDRAAEHLAEANLEPGDEVIVVGRLVNREYEKSDGTKARSLEVTADVVGVSLRFRSAQVTRVVRSDSTETASIPM